MTKKSKNRSNSQQKTLKAPNRWITVKELKPQLVPSRKEVEAIYSSLILNNRVPGSDLDVYTTLVPFEVGISSDGSGNCSNVFSNDPNNSAYWVTIASNYEQYRVFGVRMQFIPNSIHGGTTTIYKSPLIYVTDFDSSAVLTSYGLARTFSNHREVQSTHTFTVFAVEEDASSALWNDVATNPPGNALWIKFFGTGFTASTPLGRVTVDYIVQLKGRGV